MRVSGLACGMGLALMLAAGGCQNGPSTNALGIYGDNALDAENYAEAVGYYEQYVERRPLDPDGRYKLATAYLGDNRPSMAREQFIYGFELREGDDRFIEGTADTLVEMGQQDALFKLLRNRAQESQAIVDYIRLGRFSARVGDADEAEQALLFAAKLDQGMSIEPQLELAEFYGSLSDNDRKLERLRMALFIEPDNKGVMDAIRELGEVPGPAFAIPPSERG
jgi:tetratricopeptide (TPR) repeat protein